MLSKLPINICKQKRSEVVYFAVTNQGGLRGIPQNLKIMIALNLPLITWCVIAFAMTALVIVKVCYGFYNRNHARHHLIELGSEREEFFVPGDRMYDREDKYDDSLDD